MFTRSVRSKTGPIRNVKRILGQRLEENGFGRTSQVTSGILGIVQEDFAIAKKREEPTRRLSFGPLADPRTLSDSPQTLPNGRGTDLCVASLSVRSRRHPSRSFVRPDW